MYPGTTMPPAARPNISENNRLTASPMPMEAVRISIMGW